MRLDSYTFNIPKRNLMKDTYLETGEMLMSLHCTRMDQRQKLEIIMHPVSLTSVPCKVLESSVKSRILRHLNDYNLLSDYQHDFKANKSCLTNLLTTLKIVTNAVDMVIVLI